MLVWDDWVGQNGGKGGKARGWMNEGRVEKGDGDGELEWVEWIVLGERGDVELSL